MDPDQAEGLGLTLQQLQRVNISSTSGNAQAFVHQIRALVSAHCGVGVYILSFHGRPIQAFVHQIKALVNAHCGVGAYCLYCLFTVDLFRPLYTRSGHW